VAPDPITAVALRPSSGPPLARGPDVAGARPEEVSRAPLLGDVGDPTGAAAEAEEDLACPRLQTQRVRDREEPHVEVGHAEVQPRCLGHQGLQSGQRPGGAALAQGEREEEGAPRSVLRARSGRPVSATSASTRMPSAPCLGPLKAASAATRQASTSAPVDAVTRAAKEETLSS
jgi:hypothetical protein